MQNLLSLNTAKQQKIPHPQCLNLGGDYRLCYLYLRNVKGFKWNYKRIYRIYKAQELNLRIKPRKRLNSEKPEPLAVPEEVNQVWSMDFMHDQLSDGRSSRVLNVIDDYRHLLTLIVPFSIMYRWCDVRIDCAR
jgi:putative transposase